ncbi:MAG: hypothetical protein ACKO40_07660 [Planctomycetaceae bacterium]
MDSHRQIMVALTRSLIVILATAAALLAGATAADDPFVQPVAFLKAPEFDEPYPAATSGDDNIVYRLVHRLIPEGDRGRPPPCDISDPGPDTANYPNSPLTLPKGRSYVETVPGTYSLAGSDGTPATWSWPFMIRTGLTDSCEFRVISQGPTVVGATADSPAFDGFAPLVFDLKVHLWGDKDQLYVPIVGVETFVVTGIASQPFQVGTEPGMVLLVDHKLPGDWVIEWNAGLYGTGGDGIPDILSLPDLGVQWAVQKQVTENIAVFYQGFYNGAGIPYFPSDLVSGLGMQWNLGQRLAVYTSYNWSLDGEGSPSGGYSGFAYAY